MVRPDREVKKNSLLMPAPPACADLLLDHVEQAVEGLVRAAMGGRRMMAWTMAGRTARPLRPAPRIHRDLAEADHFQPWKARVAVNTPSDFCLRRESLGMNRVATATSPRRWPSSSNGMSVITRYRRR